MARRAWFFALALSVVALPQLARAEAPEAFAKLRDAAQPVESLSAFLSRFVGTCTDIEERQTCLANAKKARNELIGKSFYVILDRDSVRMFKGGSFNPANREYTIEMTPFFDGGGIGLTNGEPKGQDGEGRPRIQIEPIRMTLAPDQMPMDMERLFRTQNMKVHLVFKPLGTWSLPGKGGVKLEGVKAKFQAVRLTYSRNGDEIAMKVY
ncbi:MAG TPA: DUF6066 family protein [Myxococcales bacterium]|jgi:hypothetical protein